MLSTLVKGVGLAVEGVRLVYEIVQEIRHETKRDKRAQMAEALRREEAKKNGR
jgi:hypothetical protein